MAAFIAAYTPSSRLKRREIKIEPSDMLSWLSMQKDDVKIYGANQSDTVAIAGIGEAVSLKGGRLGPYQKVFKQLRSYLSADYPYLQWYGGFCFDQKHQDADWKGFGAYRFVIPRFELASQDGRMIFCCNLIGKEDKKNLLKQLNRMVVPGSAKAGDWTIARRTDNPNQKKWRTEVKRILSDQTLDKAVLARKTTLFLKQAPNPWAMLKNLKAVTPHSYHFAFQFKDKCFLGASPERLFRRFGRGIESEALAGTSPKSSAPQKLQNSPKNRYEHALVVDAIDISFKEICKGFQRDKVPDVLTLANGHHLITKFQGQLKDGINDEDILQFLHPTPALGGSPRLKALAKIRGLEKFSRGWYGGPIGYVGLDWAEFVVGIRSGLACGKKLSVFAGAGIVQGSKAIEEWKEVENKISNFIKIIR